MDKELKREIILDNYSNPFNKKVPNSNNYIMINTNNESCIDNLDIYFKVENKKINKKGVFIKHLYAILLSIFSIALTGNRAHVFLFGCIHILS